MHADLRGDVRQDGAAAPPVPPDPAHARRLPQEGALGGFPMSQPVHSIANYKKNEFGSSAPSTGLRGLILRHPLAS